MTRWTRLSTLAVVALVAACQPENTADPAHVHPESRTARQAAGYERDLATLRAAVSRYQTRELAAAGGWSKFLTPCFVSPNEGEGAMGFHIAREEYLADGILDPAKPEALLYEPQSNGTLRLVGVEFILPGDPTDPPPVLFGQEFSYVEAFGIWGLHVWPWLDNPTEPNGLFAPWNPRVSCRYADLIEFELED
jgi:hypothetical protein